MTRPAARPQPGTGDETPPPAIVNPPRDPNLVSVSGAGLNQLCAGDHLTLSATGGNGRYSWSPNVGLSATTGASVVVGPLTTTAYTVTSTNPSTGATTTATLNVNVLENCCPQSKNAGFIINEARSFFDAGTGSPFIDAGTGQPYPAGTRFHFTGPSPIILSGLAFRPPMGSVILLDGGKDLQVQDGASLALSGVSITAACNDMWGRLWVRNTAAGISSTFTDGADESPYPIPTQGATTLKNQLSHSLGGVEFEQSTSGGNVPYYKFTNFDFLHSEQSVKLWRANATSSSQRDYITYSLFDSKPESFKAPHYYPPTDPNYPHFSTYGVWFDGFVGECNNNILRNSLFGFFNPTSSNPPLLVLVNSDFENIWLAAVNINSDAQAGRLTIYGNSYLSGIPSGSKSFTFPTALNLPTTPQFRAALANDVLDHLPETRGTFSNAFTVCYDMTFTQTNDPYSNFTFSERYKQIGIKSPRSYISERNYFHLLHTGIELSNLFLPSTSRPPSSVVDFSVFTACRRGIEVRGSGIANRGGTTPPAATVSFPLTCNTFDRVNATRPGTMYGVYLETDARVTFDPLPAVNQPPALSNKFLDYNVGKPDFYALYNGSSTPNSFVHYTTFSDYIMRPNPLGPGILPGHSDLSGLNYGVTLTGYGTYTYGQACGTGNPGLERPAPPKSTLDPSSPNPASDHTTLHYQLAPETHTASVQIRRGTDGHLMQQGELRPGSNAYQLNLQGWAAGVYMVTLYVNGAPVKATKLFVQ